MPQASIRRLSLADLDETALRRLIEHGEDLFVERKREPPARFGLGAAVASFANTLGGWLLLGVEDDGTAVGYAPESKTDPQSHYGHVLANQVDPLPPFVAEVRHIDDTPVTILRVFESADTPHLVRETGGVYVRDARGRQPVTDQQRLLELARRGEAALEAAHDRFRSLLMPIYELPTFDRPELIAVGTSGITLIARAAPLTVTPQFSAWAISAAGAEIGQERMREMASAYAVEGADLIVRPRARGFGIAWAGAVRSGGTGAHLAVDSGGIVGVRFDRDAPADQRINPGRLRQEDLPRVIEAVASVLESAEAVGRVAWHFWIASSGSLKLITADGLRAPPSSVLYATGDRVFYASRELPSPSTGNERASLAGEIIREYVREAGAAEFEP